MSDFENRLGDKLELPYPGQGQPPAFGEDINTAFKGTNAQGNFSAKQEKSYNPAQAAPQQTAPAPQSRQQTAIPPATVKVSSTTSKQLEVFRRAFGVKRIGLRHYVAKRTVEGEELTVTFGLRPLTHEDKQWAVDQMLTVRISDATYGSIFQMAIVAICIASIDVGDVDEGKQLTPVWQVFGLQPEKPEHVSDPYFPLANFRYQTANVVWDEIRNTFHDFVPEIYDALGVTKEEPEEDGGESPLAQTDSNSSTSDSGSAGV